MTTVDSVSIICTAITALSAIAVAIIGIFGQRRSKEAEKKTTELVEREKEHSDLRRREALLSLKMVDATMQLSIVSANALSGGHNNGNVERAKIAAEAARKEYEEFVIEVTTKELCQ